MPARPTQTAATSAAVGETGFRDQSAVAAPTVPPTTAPAGPAISAPPRPAVAARSVAVFPQAASMKTMPPQRLAIISRIRSSSLRAQLRCCLRKVWHAQKFPRGRIECSRSSVQGLSEGRKMLAMGNVVQRHHRGRTEQADDHAIDAKARGFRRRRCHVQDATSRHPAAAAISRTMTGWGRAGIVARAEGLGRGRNHGQADVVVVCDVL